MENHFNPNTDERREIIAAAADVFKRRFYSPTLDRLNLEAVLDERMSALLATDAFATPLAEVFARSGARPIEVFYESERKVSLARFLKVTLFETPEVSLSFGTCWWAARLAKTVLRAGIGFCA